MPEIRETLSKLGPEHLATDGQGRVYVKDAQLSKQLAGGLAGKKLPGEVAAGDFNIICTKGMVDDMREVLSGLGRRA